MSYAVSITQDGTRLQTAGKYVDDDIVVGISDSIKKAAQTYNPSTQDQVIAAGQYLAGAQTIKAVSGTKSITANGTYDVTQFASAAVNVVSLGTNTEVLTVNVPSTRTSEFTLLNSAAIREHFASPNLAILVKKMTGETSTAGTVYLSYCGKTLLNEKAYGYHVYNSSSGNLAGNGQNSPINEQSTGSGVIYATSDGNLQFGAGSPRVRAGDYLVCIWW